MSKPEGIMNGFWERGLEPPLMPRRFSVEKKAGLTFPQRKRLRGAGNYIGYRGESVEGGRGLEPPLIPRRFFMEKKADLTFPKRKRLRGAGNYAGYRGESVEGGRGLEPPLMPRRFSVEKKAGLTFPQRKRLRGAGNYIGCVVGERRRRKRIGTAPYASVFLCGKESRLDIPPEKTPTRGGELYRL